MNIRYKGSPAKNADLGRLWPGRIMEVSDEMGNRLLNDRNLWENLAVDAGPGLEGSGGKTERVKAGHKSAVKGSGLEQPALVEELIKHHK